MNTPGFTAEAVFHETSSHYRAAPSWTDCTAKQAVLPAAVEVSASKPELSRHIFEYLSRTGSIRCRVLITLT
jgi:hypothetical protein